MPGPPSMALPVAEATGTYLLGDVRQEVWRGTALPLVVAGCVVLPARPRAWVGAWPGGSHHPAPPPRHYTPPWPQYLSKGRLFIFAFLPCSSICLCVLPLQQGGKRHEQHHQSQPWASLHPREGGGDAAGPRQRPLQEKQLLGIIPSHPPKARIKGRLGAIPTPFPAPVVWFSPGTLPVAETGALAAQKGFGL